MSVLIVVTNVKVLRQQILHCMSCLPLGKTKASDGNRDCTNYAVPAPLGYSLACINLSLVGCVVFDIRMMLFRGTFEISIDSMLIIVSSITFLIVILSAHGQKILTFTCLVSSGLLLGLVIVNADSICHFPQYVAATFYPAFYLCLWLFGFTVKQTVKGVATFLKT
jgi:hypothetical protein